MKYLVTLFLFLVGIAASQAQSAYSYSRASQKVKVFQTIGTNDMEIIYHSPLANGRKVFGELVPYDLVINGKAHPWRAGANENTTISFTHDVEINGQKLKAGKYGLHVFISEREWTFAFSKNAEAWGSFSYKAEEDAIRVKVQPSKNTFQNWLSYQFQNPASNTVEVTLRWAEMQASFGISTNVDADLISSIEDLEEQTWSSQLIAARCAFNMDSSYNSLAKKYLEASLAIEKHFTNREFMAYILDRQNKKEESQALLNEALSEATVNELFAYAMELNNHRNDEEGCLEILNMMSEKYPEHWFTSLAYANYYSSKDNFEEAHKHFEKGLASAPERAKGFAAYRYGLNKTKMKK